MPDTPFLYQQYGRYFAQAAHPTEHLAANDLRDLGARNIETAYRGVHFDADPATLYRIVYCARLITRVIAPLITFDCHSDRYLYARSQDIDWTKLIGPDRTFAVFATVSNSKISHSKYAALKVKDAVVDQIRDATGRRPDIDTRNPDVWINLHIENNRATISLDAAGNSLHRRGYRLDAIEAPLQETVAATILRMAEWFGEKPLRDPMCGSGTLLAEAHMIAARIPAAYLWDRFGFQQFPDFDAALWKQVRETEDAKIRKPPEHLIAGSDISGKAVQAAEKNLARLPHGRNVKVFQSDFRELPGFSETTIVVNPPYGVRIGKNLNVTDLWTEFGDFLKQRCTGATAFIYAGKPQLLKSVGLRSDFKNELVNGAMEGRLARYDLY